MKRGVREEGEWGGERWGEREKSGRDATDTEIER